MVISWHKSCLLLLQVYNGCICSLHFFYQNSIYYWIFYILGHTWGYDTYCLFTSSVFILGTRFLVSFLPLNLFSSLLLSFQCLSKFVVLLYYCSILLGQYSASINFLLITLFISHLNSSTNSLLLYLLSLAILLNTYTNCSIVLLFYSTFFSYATFIISLPPPLNSSFKFDKIFLTII